MSELEKARLELDRLRALLELNPKSYLAYSAFCLAGLVVRKLEARELFGRYE